MNSTTLFYIHDPMCSWCWGFSHTWNKVKNSLPSEINVQYILGGLAPDSSEVMPNEMHKKSRALALIILSGIVVHLNALPTPLAVR